MTSHAGGRRPKKSGSLSHRSIGDAIAVGSRTRLPDVDRDVVADVEVLQAALCLSVQYLLPGHVNIAKAVELSAHVGDNETDGQVENLRSGAIPQLSCCPRA